MIVFKNFIITLSLITCLSLVAHATDTDEEEVSLESKTLTLVSFIDPNSVKIFLKSVVDDNKTNNKEDSSVQKTLAYVKKYEKIRVSDREVVINCLIQKNRFDEAADFLWYTLTGLEGCDKDLFNYYRTLLPDAIEIQRPENLENKDVFKTAVIELWQNSFQDQIKAPSHTSWTIPSLDSFEAW